MESLGFANFYQYFIKNFSHTVKPLNEFKGKKEWKWEKEHKKVFKELKNKITSQLALALSVIRQECGQTLARVRVSWT